MGATEEQMQLLHDAGITHVSYVLILYSIAFVLFLFVNILLHIYAVHVWPDSGKKLPARSSSEEEEAQGATHANGSFLNGHVRSNSETQHIHDAEAYELEGLISDEEDDSKAAADSHTMGSQRVTDEESSPLVRKETTRG